MRRRRNTAAAVVLAAVLVGSVVALPTLGENVGGGTAGDGATAGIAATAGAGDTSAAVDGTMIGGESSTALETAVAQEDSQPGAEIDFELVTFDGPTAVDGDGDEQIPLQGDREQAVEAGVEEGIELVQAQGIDVTQEQRAAALEGARASVSQTQTIDAEQVQAATTGAVHGALIQKQSVNVTQIQHAVAGATDGGLSQSQSANATQLQGATWGAAHGALAQSQKVSAEQIQVASRGAAAGAAKEAGEKAVKKVPKIQEAAQGSAYGALTQYQRVTVEQRQRVTLEHVQHAAAGAAAGAIDGGTRTNVSQEQRVEIEQRQRVTIKQIQKAAAGAAKGALVQKQRVSVRQTQAAARGASRGALTQVQSIRIEQIQRVSITQVQEASFGAAKGAIAQSQEATVEQIHAAATGSASGVLVQRQTVSITQIQYAAIGAAEGAVTSAVQRQTVSVEQIQAAAFGAGEGSVTQTQLVEVTQVQSLAWGGASGALTQAQTATVEQIQTAARLTCKETAQVVQSQRISVQQLQRVTAETAADATAYAVQEETDDATVIGQRVEVIADQQIETVDRLEGTASVDVSDQTSDGQQVAIEDVSLSEGGFVAVYEGGALDIDPTGVIGVSSYLEPGTHENVTIELDDPLAGSGAFVAVPHHDTDGDETFGYVDSGGETDAPYVTGAGAPVLGGAFVTVTAGPEDANETAEPEDANETAEPEDTNETAETENASATLSVADQTGNGSTLSIDAANASVPYTVTATYDGETVESETFSAGEAVANRSLALEPPIEENVTVDVSVVGEDGATLANETIEYGVVAAPDEVPDATLSVSNQTGNGSTLTVDEASATVEYALAVTHENGTQLAVTETFGADETVVNETIELEPPLAENATLEVAVVAADDDAVLANETIAYGLEERTPDRPTDFGVSITDTNSPVERGDPIAVEAEVENVGVANGTQNVTLAIGGTPVNETSVSLEPGASRSVTLNYETSDLEPGEYLIEMSTANETAETTVTVEPTGEPASFAITDVSAPESGLAGEEVSVDVTIENQGDREGTQTVTYSIDDEPVAETSVTLAGGQATTLSVSSQLPAGTSTHTITTDDDRESVTIEASIPASD
nr:CARDB domain-containing protein [Natrinema gelatinilyticum]